MRAAVADVMHAGPRRGLGDLRSAIARGDLIPHYQPIIDMRSGRVLRFEALARWPDPVAEWVPPTRFIPLAERNGLIVPLFTSLIARALADLAGWRTRVPDLRVSLNLSARGLAHPRTREQIDLALKRTGASPDWLSVEITEEVVVKDLVRTRGQIERLRSLGIRLEIDDFGTGYSSLRYLQVLAVDAVKIDRQFVEASVTDRTSETIVRAVVGLLHELGIEAVAEGVADRAVWDFLAAVGCDSVQGYLVAEAMPASRIGPWLEEWESRRWSFTSAAAWRPSGRERTGPRVLVVDDDPSILAIVRDVLYDAGYRLETAASGREALASIEARRPSLVLLDVHMPGLDGEGLATALRERGVDVPLLVMTAGPAAHAWAAKIGARGALPKPFGIDDLLSSVSQAVAEPVLAH